jgi:hypothetical protein
MTIGTTVLTTLKVVAAGGVLGNAQNFLFKGIGMVASKFSNPVQQAAGGLLKEAASHSTASGSQMAAGFLANNADTLIKIGGATLVGVVEVLGFKWTFHDHADVSVKALGLESVYEVAPAKDASAVVKH